MAATSRQEIITALMAMNYGELNNLAGEFAAMIDKEVRPEVVTQQDFASLLFDWAEAQS